MAADPAKPRPRTLVTGGTGFLGRRIVDRLLLAGREVSVLARNPAPDLEKRGVRFIRAALDNASAVKAACAGMETVFHTAAKVGVWGPYDEYFAANVLGTRAVLNGCREHGVKQLVYTSTPSVVYNGDDLAGVDESLPLTTKCPAAYPLTKAIAEKEVLVANGTALQTIALRPHLIWGVGDPHLVPRIVARARTGRLRIVGNGRNKVDMVHIENAVDAHLLAEKALIDHRGSGRAYFITNGEPVLLWDWINQLLTRLGEKAVIRRVSMRTASTVGWACERFWSSFRLPGEPPMTRFVAAELAKDHWFNISAAKRDLGYEPQKSMAEGTAELVAALRRKDGF